MVVYAEVFDAHGNSTSAGVLLDVALGVAPADTTPPVVTLAASSTAVQVGQGATLTATATDLASAIAKVEFFRGTTKVGEDLAAPFEYVQAAFAAGDVGSVSYTARAVDAAGNAATSTAVAIAVSSAAVEAWVNPASGSDGNAGTAAAPYKTIGKAFAVVGPGGTAWLQNGSYTSANEGLTDIAVYNGLALPAGAALKAVNEGGATVGITLQVPARRQRRRPGVRCRPAGSHPGHGRHAGDVAHAIRSPDHHRQHRSARDQRSRARLRRLRRLGDLQLREHGCHHVRPGPRPGRAARDRRPVRRPDRTTASHLRRRYGAAGVDRRDLREQRGGVGGRRGRRLHRRHGQPGRHDANPLRHAWRLHRLHPAEPPGRRRRHRCHADRPRRHRHRGLRLGRAAARRPAAVRDDGRGDQGQLVVLGHPRGKGRASTRRRKTSSAAPSSACAA